MMKRENDMSLENAPTQSKGVVRVLPDGRMSRANAADYIGRAVKTLAQWQTLGIGPASVLVGGRRFYYQEELDRFISAGHRE